MRSLLESLVRAIHHGLTSWFDGSLDNFLYLVYPGIGMLLSLILLRFVIKDNIGHGVTKVLVAVSKNDSRIKCRNDSCDFFHKLCNFFLEHFSNSLECNCYSRNKKCNCKNKL